MTVTVKERKLYDDNGVIEYAVSFLFDPKSFIRDDTVIEKFYRCFASLSVRKLEVLFDLIKSVIDLSVTSFDELSNSAQFLLLRVFSLLRIIDASWVDTRISKFDFNALSNACKNGLVAIYSSIVSHDICCQFVPFEAIVQSFECPNIYLRQAVVGFFELLWRIEHKELKRSLEIIGKLEARLLTSFLLMTSVDLSSPSLLNLLATLLKNPIDPKLIIKHPEITQSVSLPDYLLENAKKPVFYDSLVFMFRSFYSFEERHQILHCFLNSISAHQETGIYTLKPHIAAPFTVLLRENKESKDLLLNEDLQLFLQQIVTCGAEPHQSYLELVSSLPDELARKVENKCLINIIFSSVFDCEPKAFEMTFKLLIKNNKFNESFWNQSYSLEKSKQNILFSQIHSISLKDCCSIACKSDHWDIRDCVCLCMRLVVELNESPQILSDIFGFLYSLMQDSVGYVLISVLTVVDVICEQNLLSKIDQEALKRFFNHAFSFCEDAIHARLLELIQAHAQVMSIIDSDLLKKTFESDLCSYETKGKAAKMLTSHNDSGDLLVPDWLELFLKKDCSDQNLVDEIEYAIGRKDRESLDEDEALWSKFVDVCRQIEAESQAVNVSLDCY